MMNTYEFLSSSLAMSPNAIGYHVSEQMATIFADRGIVECERNYFDIEAYAKAGLCRLAVRDDVHSQFLAIWDETTGTRRHGRNAWFKADWQGETFEILQLTWNGGFCDEQYIWIIGDDEASADRLYCEVSAWNAEIRDEVLVFEGGCWQKNESLYLSIQSATLENLVLKGSLKHEIHADIARFFERKSAYEQHGVPWKRGVLLLGPPGNGKTHAIKAIVNSLHKPCLYVKSFQVEQQSEHDAIRNVFARARKSSPCLLILEDLDSLITDSNRSFFLNELDGFAENTGLVVLATTNHPEKLDTAILDRPSRFDRKYHFDLPAATERSAFLTLWAGRLEVSMQPSNDGISEAVNRTEGFSFAYLKELGLSAMMCWIDRSESANMDEILAEQAEGLRTQMVSAAT